MRDNSERMDLARLYETQISLTEWLEKIGHGQTEELRKEDNEKRERLRVLRNRIGLPFDAPVKFPASQLAERTPELEQYLDAHGDELCALRLIPQNVDLPKLRMRGKTVREVMSWFEEQAIDPTQYRAEFVPHAETSTWSTIFVVTPSGVFGEIIRGGHHQLTQGVYESDPPIAFSFDFTTWRFDREDAEAEREIRSIVDRLRVDDESVRTALAEELQAQFVNGYLRGYFETATSDAFGLWFIDYNRLLGESFAQILPVQTATDASQSLTRGVCGSPGLAMGRARIVVDPEGIDLAPDEILVTHLTSPAFIPLMMRARAVVTEQGGVLSHAAIVCRELGKPCIGGTKNATAVLHDGQGLVVDADMGVVRASEV